jgi:hypothetical protein
MFSIRCKELGTISRAMVPEGVTNTLSPHPTGLEAAGPGSRTVQVMLYVSHHQMGDRADKMLGVFECDDHGEE